MSVCNSVQLTLLLSVPCECVNEVPPSLLLSLGYGFEGRRVLQYVREFLVPWRC